MLIALLINLGFAGGGEAVTPSAPEASAAPTGKGRVRGIHRLRIYEVVIDGVTYSFETEEEAVAFLAKRARRLEKRIRKALKPSVTISGKPKPVVIPEVHIPEIRVSASPELQAMLERVLNRAKSAYSVALQDFAALEEEDKELELWI